MGAGLAHPILLKQGHMATTAISRAGLGDRSGTLPPADLIFGRSAAMQTAKQKIEKVALSGVPILIQGDSGTGKGLLASFIHHFSPQPDAAFVKVNCAAIPSELIRTRADAIMRYIG